MASKSLILGSETLMLDASAELASILLVQSRGGVPRKLVIAISDTY